MTRSSSKGSTYLSSGTTSTINILLGAGIRRRSWNQGRRLQGTVWSQLICWVVLIWITPCTLIVAASWSIRTTQQPAGTMPRVWSAHWTWARRHPCSRRQMRLLTFRYLRRLWDFHNNNYSQISSWPRWTTTSSSLQTSSSLCSRTFCRRSRAPTTVRATPRSVGSKSSRVLRSVVLWMQLRTLVHLLAPSVYCEIWLVTIGQLIWSS